MYPPPNVVKYVTPHGTGDHSGSSWTNAYSFSEMIVNIASNTTYNLIDSTFIVDNIPINSLNNISLVGKGMNKTFIQGSSDGSDPLGWSIEGVDLVNADNITIKNIQIRYFRGFGIRVDAASSYFFSYNNYVDSCGWAAFGEDTIKSPCGVKLFGDDATFRKSYIMQSGWDGMQIAGYRITVDTSIIYWTGKDLPDASNQGDGVQMFKNPDSSYWVPYYGDSIEVWKTGQATFRACNINTVEAKKSGIEGGWDSIYYTPNNTPYKLEKPLVQVINSTVAGGTGLNITQDAHPRIGHFYSSVQGSKIKSLDPLHPTCRIDFADPSPYNTPQWGSIKNNTFYSPEGYDPLQDQDDCPVLEFDTDSTAVFYSNNNWRVGSADSTFCVIHNLTTP